MAHSLSAKKRIRQNAKHRAINRWRKHNYRDAISEFRETVLHGSVEDARKQLKSLYKLLDQTAAKGVLHRNTVSRYKSRLTGRLNARIESASATTPA